MKTYVIALALLLAPFATLKAEDEAAPQLVQEVFQSELVYPQEKGEVQLTIAPTWQEQEEGRARQLPLVVEYGITDAWQVGLELNALTDLRTDDGDRARGLGDLELGTKYSFMNIGGSGFHAAVGVDLTLPLADPDRGLGEGTTELEPYVALGRDLPSLNNAHLFGQVALGLVRQTRGDSDEDPAHELSVNTGLIVPMHDFRLVGELNYATNRWNHDGDESELFLTPGLVWDLPGTWELGVGVPIGLTDGADDYRVITQLTWEFGGDAD